MHVATRLPARDFPRASRMGDWGQIIGQAVVAAGQYAAAHEQKAAASVAANAEKAVAEAQKELAVIQGQVDVTKLQQQQAVQSQAAREKLVLVGVAGVIALVGITIFTRRRK